MKWTKVRIMFTNQSETLGGNEKEDELEEERSQKQSPP